MTAVPVFLFMCFAYGIRAQREDLTPVVITTWAFDKASSRAWQLLQSGSSALDAVQAGCTACEELQCDYTVGFGGSPDENGETILDAMLMDGKTLNVGAVAGLRRIKSASAVARKVLDYTEHSLLVGDLATAFARKFGFGEEDLASDHSREMISSWRENKCQPNFWTNVTPDPKTSCGPYSPLNGTKNERKSQQFGADNHDTIGMVAIDRNGDIAAGTSSNGAKYKIAGRVGDSPIPGAGCYADNDVGAAAATGDGDVMMRFLPSFVAVELMRGGSHPRVAAEQALARIAAKYPTFQGGLVVLRKDGKFAAACHGLDSFPYTVSNSELGTLVLVLQTCTSSS